MTTPGQEALWVLRAQCDDQEALECLLRSIQPSLHRFLLGVLGPSHVDDLLQDVLVIVYRKLKTLYTPELFRPWVFRIASRQAFRHVRKERRWPEQGVEESVLNELPGREVCPPAELFQELLSLEELSPASRAVLVLHFQEELPLSDVAAILEIPLGTAKSRLAYGLTTLRKHLNKKGKK